MNAEKNMILLSKKQHTTNIPHDPIDILDDYLIKYGLLKGKEEKPYKSKFMQNVYHNPYSKPAFMISPQNPIDRLEPGTRSMITGTTKDHNKSIKDRTDFNYRGNSTKVKIPQRYDDLSNQPSSRGIYGAKEYSVGKMDNSWQKQNIRQSGGRGHGRILDNNEARMELEGIRQEVSFHEEQKKDDDSDFGDLTHDDIRRQFIDLEDMIKKIDVVQSKKPVGHTQKRSLVNHDAEVSFSELDDRINKNQKLILGDSSADNYKSSKGKLYFK